MVASATSAEVDRAGMIVCVWVGVGGSSRDLGKRLSNLCDGVVRSDGPASVRMSLGWKEKERGAVGASGAAVEIGGRSVGTLVEGAWKKWVHKGRVRVLIDGATHETKPL